MLTLRPLQSPGTALRLKVQASDTPQLHANIQHSLILEKPRFLPAAPAACLANVW